MRPFTLLMTVLLMLISAAKADAAELLPIKINGLDAVLELHVRSAIALPESKTKGMAVSEGRLSYYANNINAMVEDSLEPLGYYQAKVSSRIERDQERVQLIIDVQLGDAVTVRFERVSDDFFLPVFRRA